MTGNNRSSGNHSPPGAGILLACVAASRSLLAGRPAVWSEPFWLPVARHLLGVSAAMVGVAVSGDDVAADRAEQNPGALVGRARLPSRRRARPPRLRGACPRSTRDTRTSRVAFLPPPCSPNRPTF